MSKIKDNIDPYKEPWFSLRNRLGRAFFSLTWLILCRWTPRPFSLWRVFILRLFGAKIGRGCYIDQNVEIWGPWNLQLEDEVAIAPKVFLYSMGKITLKKRSIISVGCTLCGGTHDYEDPLFQLYAKPITIEEGAWLGAQVFVHPVITIGKNAVVGACSVVTKNLPSDMICVGHPCKPLKPRIIRTS